MAAPRVAMRPQLVRPVRAASNSGAEVQEKLEEVVEIAKAKWDKLEDKPSAVAVTSAGLLALVAVSAVVDTIDRIPIISDLIELVGVGVTGWFGWRFLVFGPDREELVRNVKSFLKKVYGA